MLTATAAELEALVHNPREDMHVEIKGWLDLSTTEHKALLAKATLALANHGGGFIVIGFSRQAGVYAPAAGRPEQLASSMNDDLINGIVRAYAAPAFHCSLHLVGTPGLPGLFPVIAVPGGHRVPIQAIRGSPDQRTLINGRVYIRRPGPESAEPATPEEWRELFTRCLRANRDELLDAMRDVLSGHAGGAGPFTVPALETLLAWAEKGSDRWRELIPKKEGKLILPAGHYRFAYAIQDDFNVPSLPALKRHIEDAQIPHTGWPEWVVLSREGMRPYVQDGGLECFTATESPERLLTDPSHADFWRAMPDGRLLLIRGYQEDANQDKGISPGTAFDLALPVWRVGECFLHARAMCERLGVPNASVIVTAKYSGLSGRELISLDGRRVLSPGRKARQQEIDLALTVDGGSIEDRLPEIVAQFLGPLYNLFDLFDPPPTLFIEELRLMRRNRFR